MKYLLMSAFVSLLSIGCANNDANDGDTHLQEPVQTDTMTTLPFSKDSAIKGDTTLEQP